MTVFFGAIISTSSMYTAHQGISTITNAEPLPYGESELPPSAEASGGPNMRVQYILNPFMIINNTRTFKTVFYTVNTH